MPITLKSPHPNPPPPHGEGASPTGGFVPPPSLQAGEGWGGGSNPSPAALPAAARAAVVPGLAVLAGVALLLVALAGWWGSRLGPAEDSDSAAILAVLEPILAFDYRPSRNYGVPLYEISSAFLHRLGGLQAVNLASLAYTLLALACFWPLLRPARSVAGCLGFLGLALNPLVLINASAPIETAQLLLFFAASLLCACRFLASRRPTDLAATALLTGLTVLVRPDAAISAVALTLALVIELRADRRLAALALTAMALAGAAVVAAYIALHGGPGFLGEVVLRHDSFPRRLARAAFSLVNLYGLLGSLVLAVALWRLLAAARRQPSRLAWALDWPFLDKLLLLSAVLHAPRFVALPDELEYLLLPFGLSLVVLARRLRPWPALTLLTGSVVLNSLVHVALFAPSETGNALAFAPSLRPGALLQDWRARRFNQVLAEPAFRAFLLESALGAEGRGLRLEAPLWFPGFVADDGTALIGRDQRHRFDDPHRPVERLRSRAYRRLVVCDAPLSLQRGWRLLQPPTSPAAVESFRRGEPLRCTVVGRP